MQGEENFIHLLGLLNFPYFYFIKGVQIILMVQEIMTENQKMIEPF